jgi:serine/threonine protein kinase
VVDFDFASFHPLKRLDANRHLGSPWTAPPEYFDVASGARGLDVIGASDLWALGTILLGWRAGINSLFFLDRPWVNPDYVKQYGVDESRYVLIQAIMHKLGLPNFYEEPQHANLLMVKEMYFRDILLKLRTLSVDEQNFFRDIFDPDPMRRIRGGRLFEYLAHPVFDRWLTPVDKQAILQDAVFRHFPGITHLEALPLTTEASAQQLCALLTFGYTSVESMMCTQCVNKRASFLCTQKGKVMCEDCGGGGVTPE